MIPLSILFEDVEIIPLETRTECLIGYSTNFMTDHSVLIGVRNRAAPIRLYEFDLKGKFIRELGGVGKGPGEHLRYIYHLDDDLFMSAGVVSGIPRFKRDSFQIILHRSDGEWVKSFPRKNYPDEKSTGFSWNGTSAMWRYSSSWRLLSTGNDTLFEVTEKALNPVAIVNFGQKYFRYNESFNPQTEVGHYNIKILRETDRFLYFKKEYLYKLEAKEWRPGTWTSSSYYDYSLIISDKEKGVGYNIRFKDDLLGILQPEKHGMDCSFDEFGQPYRIVQAFQVLEWIAEAKNGQNLPAAAKERVLMLEQNLNENSNPVMFLFKQRTDKELSSRLSQMIY